MCLIQVHDHAGHRWIGAVQPHAYGAYAVGVQRKMFLFCVGNRTGEHKHKPVRIDRRLYGGLHRTSEDHLDGDVRTFTLHLQLLDLSRAACRALRSCQQGQQREHEKKPRFHQTS
jgi:hypothetical protein